MHSVVLCGKSTKIYPLDMEICIWCSFYTANAALLRWTLHTSSDFRNGIPPRPRCGQNFGARGPMSLVRGNPVAICVYCILWPKWGGFS